MVLVQGSRLNRGEIQIGCKGERKQDGTILSAMLNRTDRIVRPTGQRYVRIESERTGTYPLQRN
jgi:hypothetical protein